MSLQHRESGQNASGRGRMRTGVLVAAALSAGAIGAGLTGYAAQAGEPETGNTPAAKVAPVAVAAAPIDDPRFAVVQNGTLVRGRNAVSSARLAAGNYEVVFDRDVRGCAYVGTSGNPGGGNPTTGQIAVAQRNGNVNAVYVDTRDSAGTSVDRFFHLAVIC